MLLLGYYKYIYNRFLIKTRNEQTAEDYTQELYLRWAMSKSTSKRISIKFVNILVTHVLHAMLTSPNRWAKRKGETVEFTEAHEGVWAYEHPYVDRIFTRQLIDIVNNIKHLKLKKAILIFMKKYGELSKADAKYWQILKYYQPYLKGLVCS